MALSLLIAEESHADRIATIHMAAFGANVLLQAQFPTPAIRQELKKCIAEKAVEDIRDPKTAVTIIQYQDQIISFAKWHLPILESEAYIEPLWRWPEGTNFSILEEWGEKVEMAKQTNMGKNMPCYRKLSNISLFFHPYYSISFPFLFFVLKIYVKKTPKKYIIIRDLHRIEHTAY